MRLAAVLLCWTILATPGRVIDADTLDVDARIWLGLTARERVRVLGVDAIELREPGGAAAKVFVEAWVAGQELRLTACRRDSFGRLLADVVRVSDGADLAFDLIRAEHGVAR